MSSNVCPLFYFFFQNGCADPRVGSPRCHSGCQHQNSMDSQAEPTVGLDDGENAERRKRCRFLRVSVLIGSLCFRWSYRCDGCLNDSTSADQRAQHQSKAERAWVRPIWNGPLSVCTTCDKGHGDSSSSAETGGRTRLRARSRRQEGCSR